MILTEEQMLALIDKVNEKVDIPVMGERAEEFLFSFTIPRLITEIENQLPTEWLEFLSDINAGLTQSDEEIEFITQRLATFINGKVNIPVVSEKHEYMFILVVVGIIIESMREHKALAA